MQVVQAIFKNWHTTLAGVVILILAFIPQVAQTAGLPAISPTLGVPAALGLIFAKDANKTGIPEVKP